MLDFDADFYDLKSDVQYNLGLKTIKEFDVQNGESILDIGCGTGRLTIELAKRNSSGTIIGLDPNPDMIQKAKENIQRSGITNIQLITSGILEYKPKIQFHGIFSNSALHWIKETYALYRKVYALLQPGGRLVAQTPTMGGYSDLAALFLVPIQPLNLSRYFKNWQYPIKLVKPHHLQKLLSSIGYQDIQIWNENHEVKFDNAEDLFNFLRTAALVPVLSQLPPEKKESYLTYLLNTFKTKENLGLHLSMKRLFLKIKKGFS